MRGRLVAVMSDIVAVGTKELRGRMRGSRAFIGVTAYLAVLAGVAVLVYFAQRDLAASQTSGGGNPYASAQVGQALFATLLLIQVLLVVFLAPAATSGAISLEREKQTLDLLAATPVSTLGIVLGKLVSALAFVLVLILASIPMTAVVFLFGGVAPDDVLRGYVVLIVTAIGFGSVGLFLSSLTRRTQTATVLTYLAVLILTVGTGFGLILQFATGTRQAIPAIRDLPAVMPDEVDTTQAPATDAAPWPPELIFLLNPVVAAADVLCGMDVNPYSTTCQVIASVTGKVPGGGTVQTLPGVPESVKPRGINFGGGFGGGVSQPFVVVNGDGANVAVDAPVVAEPIASASTRDTFWPHAAAAWLVASTVLVLLSVQMVSPTRRWRIPRRRPRREIQA